MTITELIAEATKVLNATEPGENTADRVGNILKGTLEHLETLVSNMSSYASANSNFLIKIPDISEAESYTIPDLEASTVIYLLESPEDLFHIILPHPTNNIGKRLILRINDHSILLKAGKGYTYNGYSQLEATGAKDIVCFDETRWFTV